MSLPVSRRKVSSARAASISVSLPFGALGIEPVQEAYDRGAVAQVRRAGTFQLRLVLARLHQRGGVLSDLRRAARLFQQARQFHWHGRGIEEHAPMLLPQPREIIFEARRLFDLGIIFEIGARCGIELGRLDIKPRFALVRNQGEGQRQRRVRDICAADIERPGDGMRIADDESISLAERLDDPRQLLFRRLAREPWWMPFDRALRRRWPVRPDGIDRVKIGGDERRVRIARALS